MPSVFFAFVRFFGDHDDSLRTCSLPSVVLVLSSTTSVLLCGLVSIFADGGDGIGPVSDLRCLCMLYRYLCIFHFAYTYCSDVVLSSKRWALCLSVVHRRFSLEAV